MAGLAGFGGCAADTVPLADRDLLVAAAYLHDVGYARCSGDSAVPERTVRGKWREWGLPAYRIGKHLRWRERDVHAWIDRQAA